MDSRNYGMDVILESPRDQRTLDYLVECCGVERVRRARANLPGETRPYVSNLAKTLGVKVPESVVLTPHPEGQVKIAEIARDLAAKLAARRPR